MIFFHDSSWKFISHSQPRQSQRLCTSCCWSTWGLSQKMEPWRSLSSGHDEAPLPCFASCVCLRNESFTISKIFSRRERCGILKSKWFRVILNAFGVYIYIYTYIDRFSPDWLPRCHFLRCWGHPRPTETAKTCLRSWETFWKIHQGNFRRKMFESFWETFHEAKCKGRSYFCDGSNSFFRFFFSRWFEGSVLREGGDDRIPLFLDVF